MKCIEQTYFLLPSHPKFKKPVFNLFTMREPKLMAEHLKKINCAQYPCGSLRIQCVDEFFNLIVEEFDMHYIISKQALLFLRFFLFFGLGRGLGRRVF